LVFRPQLVFENAQSVGGHEFAVADRSSEDVRDLRRAAIPI
jgi:hypothetical protein